jgi:chromosome partitioning protein
MILLVGNLKGGTGKSTITFNLGVWCAYNFRRTLLIDTDPLHTITNLLVVRTEERHQPVIYSLIAKETEVAEEVARVRDLFDDIIVDIAAGDKEGFRAALQSADKVLIPLLPGPADVWALHDVLTLINEARSHKPDLPVMAVINKADTNVQIRETAETEEALIATEGITLAPTRIGYRVLMRRSLTEGLGVAEWAPRSPAALEMEALARFVFGVG